MKRFVCAECGADREGWQVIESGWPENPQYWCLWPDHRPVGMRKWRPELSRHMLDLGRAISRTMK